MSGKNLYSELTSKRDYSGSKADEYAQLLDTIYNQIGKAIYPLLENAVGKNKSIAVANQFNLADVLVDEITVESIIFI
jgi:hypothetical protein